MPRKRTSLLLFSLTAATAHAEPRTTLSTDPIGLVSGTYALSITHLIASRVALRADGALNPDVGSISGPLQLGLGAQVFLHTTAQGPFLEGGLVARHAPVSQVGIGQIGGGPMTGLGGLGGGSGGQLVGTPVVGYVQPANVVTFGPAVHVGWQHTFESGMMLAAAIGATRTWVSAPAGIERVAGTSYLRAGYAW